MLPPSSPRRLTPRAAPSCAMPATAAAEDLRFGKRGRYDEVVGRESAEVTGQVIPEITFTT